jgi:ribonuclease J
MKPGNELLFLALGGSAEIGMNANLYGCDGKWIMLDLGVSFGSQEYPGIDLILPDLDFIEERRKDLLGIVLTHGHEDHIGAVPYLAEELGVPIFANKFTADLVKSKLQEDGRGTALDIRVIEMTGEFDLGPFHIQFMPLAHSIPDMCAAIIDTPYGRVFHTGDWKLDDAPQMGAPATAEQLTAIGDAGVLALVCDSTNVFNAQPSGSEGDVRTGLMEVVANAPNRVVVTTFASNAARLQTIGAVAKASGRELCVAGRSLNRVIGVAKQQGYLKDFPESIDFQTAMKLPRNKVLVVATGGQGEPRAALGRIAGGQHEISLQRGDMVAFSSKQIPGNELAIGKIMNQLAESGIQTVTEKQAHIHVSGHPGRPELEAMYGWLRPQILVPVHGEVRHMMEQCRVGQAAGIPTTLFQKNGQLVRIAPGKPKVIDEVRSGRLALDGDVILPADGTTINERRKLALFGQMSVAVALDAQGRLVGNPAVRHSGVPVEDEANAFEGEVEDAVAKAVMKKSRDRAQTVENLRLAARRIATEWTGKKPQVDVLIIDV